MHDMVDEAAHRRGARLGVAERQEIVLDKPDEMRQRDRERDQRRHVGTRRAQRRARVTVDDEKKRHRQRQHDDEILRPQREPAGETEQAPVAHAAGAQRAVEREAGERPERQLDHVVIELGGGEIEIVQPVDDQHGDERAGRPDQPPRQGPHQREGGEHRDLADQVVDRVDPERLIGGFDHPPGQRRQLVVAELPFAPVGQRLDQVERQIGVERGRQDGPYHRVHQRKDRKALARALLQAVEHSGDHRGRAAMDGLTGDLTDFPSRIMSLPRCMPA